MTELSILEDVSQKSHLVLEVETYWKDQEEHTAAFSQGLSVDRPFTSSRLERDRAALAKTMTFAGDRAYPTHNSTKQNNE